MQLDELAYLATCNRVELIFARSERTPVQDLRRDAFTLLTGRAPAHGEAEQALARVGTAKAPRSTCS